jgi:hypothetical protein
MARLRIGVEQLGAEGFRLDLEGRNGGRNVIALAPGGGIRGRLEQDEDAIRLIDVRADTLAASELSWMLARGELRGTARLHDVQIDASLAIGAARQTRPSFVGTIRAGRIEADVSVKVGDVALEATTVSLGPFELIGDDEGRLSVRLGEATGSSVRGNIGPIAISADEVSLPGAVSLTGGDLRIEQAEIGTLEVRVPDLAALRRPAASPGRTSATSTPAWLSILDLLEGHVAVDLGTDVTVPVLGRRAATHRFRIPIVEGAIDFRALEKNLATLENLVLDFELEDDKLVLEKDIPLVPFDNKPLVQWPLDAGGHALARTDRIRLAVLARPELPASTKAEADQARRTQGSAVQLRKIDARRLDVELRVAAPFQLSAAGGRVCWGGNAKPSVGALRVRGDLAHVPGDPPPGELGITAKDLHASLDDISLGGTRRLTVGALHLPALERLVVAFAGLRPGATTGKLTGLRLAKIDLRAAKSA